MKMLPMSGDTVARPRPALSWEVQSQAWVWHPEQTCTSVQHRSLLMISTRALPVSLPPSLLQGSRGQTPRGQDRAHPEESVTGGGVKGLHKGNQVLGGGTGKGRSQVSSGSPHPWGENPGWGQVGAWRWHRRDLGNQGGVGALLGISQGGAMEN